MLLSDLWISFVSILDDILAALAYLVIRLDLLLRKLGLWTPVIIFVIGLIVIVRKHRD